MLEMHSRYSPLIRRELNDDIHSIETTKPWSSDNDQHSGQSLRKGGSRSIGAAIAKRLAASGAAVASPEAAFVTGAEIVADGGFTA
jgi:hypothetical protein